MYTSDENIATLDRTFVWHPCTQMKDHEVLPPLEIVRAEGVYLYTADGRRLIDAISSWWVNLLGHTHPRLTAALSDQAATLEHVIFAGFTHAPGARLAAALCRAFPGGAAKCFFADCGSAAVEVALKMSFQFWQQTGHPRKTRFATITGAYHGETIGALSAGAIPLYRDIFKPLLLDTLVVQGPTCFRCPYGLSRNTCSAECFEHMQRALQQHADQLAAVCIEPLVQCANGMNMYSPHYLTKLAQACHAFHVHLIADEIAVGFGRTGRLFACEHVNVRPDFMCLSKGLTGGYMPGAVVLIRDQSVFDAFYGEYVEFKAFYHSHSYTGNPMACRLALEVLNTLHHEILPNLQTPITAMSRVLAHLATLPHVGETRQCGMIGAIELVADRPSRQPYPPAARIGWHVYREALRRGALLRPLGDVIYFLPPLTITPAQLEELGAIAAEAIVSVTGS
ncbi:MAG: adenosylmethionine--8-amino-7-oxononanoate transaminase [bacterium]|nr:adenosylmethionine--8-amino-7-oxononanoate transaminase [bacterium]